MTNLCNFNGKIIPVDNLVYPIFSPAVSNGESLTEFIRIYNGKTLFSEEHYFHLVASMRIMRIEIPMNFTPDFFQEQIDLLIHQTQTQNTCVRFQVAVAPTGIDFWLTLKSVNENLIIENSNYNIEVYKEAYMPSGFYSQLFVPNPIHRIIDTYRQENHYSDLILLNESKKITSSLFGSIFAITRETIQTPNEMEGVKTGIWRKKMIEALTKSPEFNIETTKLFPFALQKADEVFIVKEGIGIENVASFRKKTYSSTQTKEDVLRWFLEVLE